jgi:hypothetical protein
VLLSVFGRSLFKKLFVVSLLNVVEKVKDGSYLIVEIASLSRLLESWSNFAASALLKVVVESQLN